MSDLFSPPEISPINFDTLWDYQNPDKTESRFRELLPLARQSSDTGYLAELLTQIARCQGLQRHFESAHATLDEVKALLPEATPRAHVRYLLERGRAYNTAGETDTARDNFRAAWHLAVEHGEDGFAVDAAHMMAIVEPGTAGLDWNLAALELCERSEDPSAQKWKGSLLNNIGWSYHELGRFEEALDSFQRGLEWQQSAGKAREARIAAWTVARTLRSLGRAEEALAIQLENLSRIRETGDSDGFVEEEIAECLLALGRADEARPHFARACETLSKDPWLSADEPERLERLKKLGSEDRT
jgi:tetratricopeptide (TPR) repeat protein